MTEITFALGIPHAAHRPERRESMARLRGALDVTHFRSMGMYYREFTRQCTYQEWATELWEWQYATGASHCLTLQDDVKPMRDFWGVLVAMIEAQPDKVLALETVHPAAREFARNRSARFVISSDGLIGVQYVIPRFIMGKFLFWKRICLRPDAFQHVTEDTLINMFLLDMGIRAWHPIPAIAEHDVTIPSTNKGFDSHPYRNVSVTWRDGDMCGWTEKAMTESRFWGGTFCGKYVGRFYTQTVEQCRKWVLTFTDEKYQEAKKPNKYSEWIIGV